MSSATVPTQPIQMIFEDDSILAVSKPSGLPSNQGAHENSVEVQMLASRPDLPELTLLHRLDTGTSGVLLFAKNLIVYEAMREKFKNREIKKFYRAWSAAKNNSAQKDSVSSWFMPQDWLLAQSLPYTINLPLAHHPKNKKKMIVLPPDRNLSFRGKPIPAQTIIHAINKNASDEEFEFEVQITTGVMHQIRVHLAYYNFALVGDTIYNVSAHSRAGARLGLHAERVEFVLGAVKYKIEDLNSEIF